MPTLRRPQPPGSATGLTMLCQDGALGQAGARTGHCHVLIERTETPCTTIPVRQQVGRTGAQFAAAYASRTLAGMWPRSETS